MPYLQMIVLTVCVFMGQILSGAMGVDIDETTWETPAMRTRVKEIDLHEAHTFEVIVTKNGIRMTITPALRQAGKRAQEARVEQIRQAALLGLGGKQISSSYTCPFMMANCNGKMKACARCQPLLGEWVKKPKWPTCPFGTATCTHESRACAKCRQQ